MDNVALGIGAALAWIVILLHAARHPASRLWPPRNPGAVTVLWSWGLTILIYVGLVRTGVHEGNTLDLPDMLRVAGLVLTVGGSVLQSWGTYVLGVKATSGWPRAGHLRETRGPYGFVAHPQYLGQAASFAGIALAAGGVWVWPVALCGCVALALAAAVEDVHLERPPSSQL